MGIVNYTTFIATALFFVMTPGIDTMFVLNKSIAEGRREGMFSTMGINSGIILHTLFAALGLSAIVTQSSMAFEVVKYLGAIYIIYLGVDKLLSKKDIIIDKRTSSSNNPKKGSFISGMVTNTLNPKVALFFLAFFPQFIKQEELQNPTPFIVLGLSYAVIGLLWYTILTLFAATFAEKFKANPKAGQLINKYAGVIFILMGLKVVLSRN